MGWYRVIGTSTGNRSDGICYDIMHVSLSLAIKSLQSRFSQFHIIAVGTTANLSNGIFPIETA
jgi:hypothetical protein